MGVQSVYNKIEESFANGTKTAKRVKNVGLQY